MASELWSFDDDRQQHVEAAQRPARILAYAQAAQTLVGLGVPVAGYFGSQHHADSEAQPAAGLDIPCVGSGDGVDLDLVRSLGIDLVVGVTYAGEVYGVSEDVAAQLAAIAPTVLIGIAGDRTLDSVIRRFHELAASLGGTPDADPESTLTSALDGLGATTRVTALSGGTPTDAYVANPAYWPSLRLLADAGVAFTTTPATGGWEVVKWDDLATSHPADVLLYDERPNSLSADQLADIPAWPQHPGAARVLPWNPEPPLTFTAAAAYVTAVANAL